MIKFFRSVSFEEKVTRIQNSKSANALTDINSQNVINILRLIRIQPKKW
jgi:hypothetical protein